MEPIEIGIVDTRNLLKLLLEEFQYDFNDYSLISLKRRFENSIQLHNMKFADILATRLKEDKSFFDLFLHEISVESTEMFRDPSLWRLLRDEFFPAQIIPGRPFHIWIPSCVSGDELFTLGIVLHECGLADQVSITAGYLSDASLAYIQSGALKLNKMEISTENYKRYQGKHVFADYFQGQGANQTRRMDLLKNLKYLKHNLSLEEVPKGVDLVIFRNRMIYYNQNFSDKISAIIWETLNPAGHLIVGIKELVLPSNVAKTFRLVNENESIYQKK
jgi:chemotaxis protein methyltransferase CheR